MAKEIRREREREICKRAEEDDVGVVEVTSCRIPIADDGYKYVEGYRGEVYFCFYEDGECCF